MCLRVCARALGGSLCAFLFVELCRETLGNCLFRFLSRVHLCCVGALKRSVFKCTLILRLQITRPRTWPDALHCAPQVETCPTSPACSDYD